MKSILGLLLLLYLPGPVTAGELNPYQGFDEAPALSLEDVGHTVHSLADYRGRVVLVNFWASWCAPCIIEIPSMQRLAKALAGKPFTILAINVRESPVKVWKFAARLGITFPLLLDRDGQATADWQVDVYPSSFLVDPQGRIQYVSYGARKWDDAQTIRLIEGLIGGSQTTIQQAK